MKRTAGSLLKTILLFPMKVLLRVIEIALILSIAVIISLGILCFSRSSQPMQLAEAQGMSYSEFLKDRVDAIDPNGTFLTRSKNIYLPVLDSAIASIPYSISAIYPASKIDQWTHTQSQYYNFCKPELESGNTLTNFPNLYWTAFEHTNWANLVLRLPSVRYPDIPYQPTPTLTPDNSGSSL